MGLTTAINPAYVHPHLIAGLEREMVIDFYVNDDGRICVFHDRPFPQEIAWLEFLPESGELDFVRDDGTICTFGVAVNAKLKPHFLKAHEINLIQINKQTGIVSGVQKLPINIQAG